MSSDKCKGCPHYGQPYWSIINPCDNCTREVTYIETFTRWSDPTIEEYKKKIEKLELIINKLEEYLEEKQKIYGINQQGFSWGVCGDALEYLKELKEVVMKDE